MALLIEGNLTKNHIPNTNPVVAFTIGMVTADKNWLSLDAPNLQSLTTEVERRKKKERKVSLCIWHDSSLSKILEHLDQDPLWLHLYYDGRSEPNTSIEFHQLTYENNWPFEFKTKVPKKARKFRLPLMPLHFYTFEWNGEMDIHGQRG